MLPILTFAPYIFAVIPFIGIWLCILSNNTKFTPPTLLAPFIGLACGIYIQKYFPQPLIAWILLGILSLCFLWYTKRYAKNPQINLAILSFVFFIYGATALILQMFLYNNIRNEVLNNPIDVHGIVITKASTNTTAHKEVITLVITAISPTTKNCTIPLHTKILCYFYTPTKMQPGQRVSLRHINLTAAKETLSLTGNPSFTDYLIKENIAGCAFLTHADYTIIYPPNPSWYQVILQKRSEYFYALQSKMPHKIFAYFASIFLGEKTDPQAQKIKTDFQFWGISHQIARSGLHIALFVFTWNFFLCFIPLAFIFKHLLLLALCLVYALLSWASISFLRALGLFFLYEMGVIFNRQTHFFYLLLILSIWTLLINPMQLFFLDFQLSFGITIALAWQNSYHKKIIPYKG